MCTSNWKIYSAYYNLHIVKCTLHRAHCTVLNLHFILHKAYRIMYTENCTCYTVYCKLSNVYFTPPTAQCGLYPVQYAHSSIGMTLFHSFQILKCHTTRSCRGCFCPNCLKITSNRAIQTLTLLFLYWSTVDQSKLSLFVNISELVGTHCERCDLLPHLRTATCVLASGWLEGRRKDNTIAESPPRGSVKGVKTFKVTKVT